MRLDTLLYKKGLFYSRNKAAEAVKRGEVLVNGKAELKPAAAVTGEESIEIVRKKEFVSLGGYKLDKALEEFGEDVSGLVFADIGASTGGFTDCLLQRGAKKIYAIDVGKGLLHSSLCQNERVVSLEGVNARYLTRDDLGTAVDAVVADCSFISLKLILPTVKLILKGGGFAVVLVKPQFECGDKRALGKSGILRNEREREKILRDIFDFALSLGFSVDKTAIAPEYKDKNKEYLLKLTLND